MKKLLALVSLVVLGCGGEAPESAPDAPRGVTGDVTGSVAM